MALANMIRDYFSGPVRYQRHRATGVVPGDYTDSAAGVLSVRDCEAALDEISSWQGYCATALHSLQPLANELGCESIHYKDESSRFGLGSFKALGGAYAVLRLVQAEYRAAHNTEVSTVAIRAGKCRDFTRNLTVATATDGNHGRSVAWGARQAGCQCQIYIHREVSEGRAAAMSDLGAEVIRVDGDYDESVHECAQQSDKNGWRMVSDTSYQGYLQIPQQVMAGYTVIASEVLQQAEQPFTHVFLQAGVGGLAAAVSAGLWMHTGAQRPVITVVESDFSACVMQSFATGEAATVPITDETVMAGLSCGEMSLLAWQVLSGCVDHVISLPDDQVAPAMAMMADAATGLAIEAGECAVPGLLALMASVDDGGLKQRLGLDTSSRVLVLGCEGATDAEVYQRMVAEGRAAVAK